MYNNSIQKKFLKNMVLIAITSISLWSFLWIQNEYSYFKKTSRKLCHEYIKSQKLLIKSAVYDRVKLIQHRRSQEEEVLKSQLKNRIDTAYNIAFNIYQNNIGKPREQIGRIIKKTLRSIRFDNGKGCYFAGSMDGIAILYPTHPELEGTNMINLKDSYGNFVIQDKIKIIKESSQGFVTHYWPKPGGNPEKPSPKISFIKYFKPLKWYLATDTYLDKAKNQIQRKLVERLAEHRFGINGYFFGTTYNGDPLFYNGKVTLGQGNIWELTDPDGIKIIQEQRKAVNNKGGGFVKYSWPKLNSSTPLPKISFILGVPEWDWMIGAGFYTDDIDKIIAAKRTMMESHLKKQIIRSVLTLALLILLILLWSKNITKQIQNEVDVFSSCLKKANTDSIIINIDQIKLEEFKKIAFLTNEMLKYMIRAEEAMQESEEKFRRMYESTQIGIAIVSLDFKILQANKAYCNMLGYSENELTGKTIQDITCKDDLPENIDQQKQLGQGKIATFQMEKRFIHKNGNTIHGILSASLIKNQNNKPLYFLGSVVDITDKIKAETTKNDLENKLQHAQKMEAIGSLAGGIAHDFNNILFSIIGFTELTLENLSEQSMEKNNLNQVLIAANRAKEMVQHILAFSRKTDSVKQAVKIQSILKEVLKLLKSSIPSTIEIKKNIDDKCGYVIADPVQIHQVIMNLATNAFHAMKDNGGIMEFIINQENITIDDLAMHPNLEPGNYIAIIVKDTGKGINDEIIDKIFNPYFTTKRTGEGTGMGLSVVHGIVLDHGGDILVKSEPGKGSTFKIILPIAEKIKEIKHDIKPSKNDIEGTENILIIDDEKQIVDMTSQLLQRLGYNVTPYTDSVKALETFKKDPDQFDVIITDVTMPKLTGIELAAELFKIKPDVKIILCSGYSDLIDKETALATGIKIYMTKPVTQKDIAKNIRKILQQEQE